MREIEFSAPHSIFSISDFADDGSPETIRKILFLATQQGLLQRVAQGIYVKPKDSRFGNVPIPLENIAKKIAERDKCQILPSGPLAANIIGLSSQIPMHLSYITSGSSRDVKIGERSISFHHASPKIFRAKGTTVPLIIEALKDHGGNELDEEEFTTIRRFIIKNSDPHLPDDISLAPVWIQKIIRAALK